MTMPRWTQLLGMVPNQRRWERPLLFFGALCAADLVWLILAPSFNGNPTSPDTTFSLFNVRTPGAWLELFFGNLLLTIVATLTFGLVRNLFAIPIAAISYVLTWTGFLYLMFLLYFPERPYRELRFWDRYQVMNIVSSLIWMLVFFCLLELAMQLIDNIALALLLGSVATSVLMFPVPVLLSSLFLDGPGSWKVRLTFLPFNVLAQAIFMLALWGGLRISSGPRPLDDAPIGPRISKGYYVGTLAVTQGLTIVVTVVVIIVISFTSAWTVRQREDITPLLLFLLFMLLLAAYGAIVFCHLIYKMWQSIQDGYVRTASPGWAVGGLFIPFYNLYWAFQAIPGFVPEYYAFAWRHGLSVPRLSKGIFTAYVVLCIVALVPLVNLLTIPAVYVVLLLMALEISKAVNAIPVASPHPQHATWQMPPPQPYPGPPAAQS